MGLIGGLLLLPITGPVWAFRLFLEQIREEAEAVLHDEGRAFAELIDLSMRHNAGQLSDAEFAEQETELLERLSSIREYKEELLHPDEDEDEDVDATVDDDDALESEPDDGESALLAPEPDVREDSW